MQISDLLGQYSHNVKNGSEELRGAQGVQRLVSTMKELTAGSVFEGTVSQAKNGKVLLALGNGQTLVARLEGKLDLAPGTPMFFQVRSNDGSTISIRPYAGAGNANNPILLNALAQAQVPVTERTLAMVDAMMQEQMPIDRESVADMYRLINATPGANVQTIVQMLKLGLPVTEEMAAQFENYLTDRHALLSQLDLAASQLSDALGSESAEPSQSAALFQRITDILLSQDPQAGANPAAGEGAAGAKGAAPNDGFVTLEQALAKGAPGEGAAEGGRILAALGEDIAAGEAAPQARAWIPEAFPRAVGLPLSELFSEEQLSALNKSLQSIPILAGNEEVFITEDPGDFYVNTMQGDGDEALAAGEDLAAPAAREPQINRDLTTGQFLRALADAFAKGGEFGFSGTQRLFSGREFQMALRNVLEEQWLLKPQDLKDGKKLDELYARIERQAGQIEAAIRAQGNAQSSFSQTAADIRGNLDFMNQMNQIYHYVQIPLQMSGKNANGELYVYANRKNLRDPDAELTAFLHLDLEDLGSTDVSVRMMRRQVRTNFYFEDDASLGLVEKHLPILEKRLKNKGYQCTLTISKEKQRSVSFKENFMKRGRVSTGGGVHRYSFDVRA